MSSEQVSLIVSLRIENSKNFSCIAQVVQIFPAEFEDKMRFGAFSGYQ